MRGQEAWETVKVQGSQALEELRRLLHEGNVRRVVVKQRGRSIAEFPVTLGVVGALAAPALAAVGALVAVLADCSVDVERGKDERASAAPRAEAAPTRGTARAKAARRATRTAAKPAAKPRRARG